MSYDLTLYGDPETSIDAYDKVLVEDLVREYFRDLDVAKAARRLGIPWQQAFKISRSRQFELLKADINDMRDAKDVVSKAQIVLRLWEEGNNFIDGNATSRQGALKQLTDILGFNAPTETNINFKAAAVVNITQSEESIDVTEYENDLRDKLRGPVMDALEVEDL